MILAPNNEYVVSIRAFNNMGDGQPIYDVVRTREITSSEISEPLTPPLGLKTIILSSTSCVLTWSDSNDLVRQENTNFLYFFLYQMVKFLPKSKLIENSFANMLSMP